MHPVTLLATAVVVTVLGSLLATSDALPTPAILLAFRGPSGSFLTNRGSLGGSVTAHFNGGTRQHVRGLELNGYSGNVEFDDGPTAVAVAPAAGPFTVSAWFRVRAAGTPQTIFSRSTESTSNMTFVVSVQLDGTLRASVGGAMVSTDTAIVANSWVMATIVNRPSLTVPGRFEFSFYVNGSLVEKSLSGSSSYWGTVVLGARRRSADGHVIWSTCGFLGEFYYHTAALSDSDVSELFFNPEFATLEEMGSLSFVPAAACGRSSFASPTPTPAGSTSATSSRTLSPSSSVSRSGTPTKSKSVSRSRTPASRSRTPSRSTVAVSNSPAATPSSSTSNTPSSSASSSGTSSSTASVTGTSTVTGTGSLTQTASHSGTATDSPSTTGTTSSTVTVSFSATPSNTPTSSLTKSTSLSTTATVTVSATSSISVSPTSSSTASLTGSISQSSTPSVTPSISLTASLSASISFSITPSQTASLTNSPTVSPSLSSTSSRTLPPSVSSSPSNTISVSATISRSPTASPSFSVDSLTSGLVAWWPLGAESNSTVALDISGNNYHGAITGSPSYRSDQPYSIANKPTAIELSGTNQYIQAPVSWGNLMTGGISMAAWFRPYELRSWTGVQIKNSAIWYSAVMRMDPSSLWTLSVATPSSSWRAAASTATVVFNTWTHVMSSYNRDSSTGVSTLRVFTNGQLAGQLQDSAGHVSSTDTVVNIGRYEDNTGVDNRFRGQIVDVRIFSRTLNMCTALKIFENDGFTAADTARKNGVAMWLRFESFPSFVDQSGQTTPLVGTPSVFGAVTSTTMSLSTSTSLIGARSLPAIALGGTFNDYVRIPVLWTSTGQSFIQLRSAISISIWARPRNAAAGKWNHLVQISDVNNSGGTQCLYSSVLRRSSSDTYQYSVATPGCVGWRAATHPTVLSDNNSWTHLVGVFRPNPSVSGQYCVQLFVNGIMSSQVCDSLGYPTAVASTPFIELGRLNWPPEALYQGFSGDLADVRISGLGLNASQAACSP